MRDLEGRYVRTLIMGNLLLFESLQFSEESRLFPVASQPRNPTQSGGSGNGYVLSFNTSVRKQSLIVSVQL